MAYGKKSNYEHTSALADDASEASGASSHGSATGHQSVRHPAVVHIRCGVDVQR